MALACPAALSELMFPCNGNFPGTSREKLASMRPLVAGGNRFKKDIE
jgi:hypothetical protein